ncbi:MAG: hypothetical protein KGL39_59975 [Patescibacteria group bacterium]|nr:hypothetical protein [Patescibacteria group bacterium]
MNESKMRRKGTKVIVRDGCNDRCGQTGTVVAYDAEQAAITVRFDDGDEQNYDYLALDLAK